MQSSERSVSVWEATVPQRTFPPLAGEAEADDPLLIRRDLHGAPCPADCVPGPFRLGGFPRQRLGRFESEDSRRRSLGGSPFLKGGGGPDVKSREKISRVEPHGRFAVTGGRGRVQGRQDGGVDRRDVAAVPRAEVVAGPSGGEQLGRQERQALRQDAVDDRSKLAHFAPSRLRAMTTR